MVISREWEGYFSAFNAPAVFSILLKQQAGQSTLLLEEPALVDSSCLFPVCFCCSHPEPFAAGGGQTARQVCSLLLCLCVEL